MEKKILLIQTGLFAIMISCVKPNEVKEQKVTCIQFSDYNKQYNWTLGPVCMSDTCSKYQAIWKELFVEKNNLSQNYFDKHITPSYSRIDQWDEGVSFRICYKVTIGWAVVYRCDVFIIKIKKDNHLFPAINLPRDILLSKDDIRLALNTNAFSSLMLHLSGDETLLFNSNLSAMDKLISDSNLNTLCFKEIRINDSGHMVLEAGAQYVNKENSCVEGYIDLINGETTFADVPCYYTIY